MARPSRAKGCLTWLSDDQWLWPRWPRQCWCQLVSSRLGSRKNPRSFQPNMSAIVSCQVKICEVAPMFNIFGRLWKPQHDFSRMRSKGSRFTLGVWGLRVCSLDVAFTVATVRNRSQPSATVRKPFARLLYGRAYGKFCRGGHFWRFQTSRCFVSRGRRGTS